jgi:hypothetical protein
MTFRHVISNQHGEEQKGFQAGVLLSPLSRPRGWRHDVPAGGADQVPTKCLS